MATIISHLLAADSSVLLPARWQMSVSLGTHIVLSCFGVAFPAMIWVIHGRGIRNSDDVALGLAKRWSKVAAVLFAVGAVSGTILSFEMGLLWPEFMRQFGDVIGLPFALEGIAFFLEAIFLGIYLYGWGRLPAKQHRAVLIPIALSGVAGTFCILAVNSWMNSPTGFRVVNGEIADADPWAAMFNGAVWLQFLHMWIATFMVVGFCVAAVYAVGILRGRDDRHHRLGFVVPFAFAAIAAVGQPLVGHLAGQRLASAQPSKLAAMELSIEGERRSPLIIGGVIIDGEVRFGLEIPVLGSVISRSDPNGFVPGLSDFPEADRPNDHLASAVHLSFQGMVGCGFALVGVSAWYWLRRRRGGDPLSSRRFLFAAVAAGPLSVLALELGWMTTELGRQPWIVYRVMRVSDAVARDNAVWASFVVLLLVYAGMVAGAIAVLRSMSRRWREGATLDLPTPYSRGHSRPSQHSSGPPEESG
jgi:cytochrome d ubiquinol oxidase subunit I